MLVSTWSLHGWSGASCQTRSLATSRRGDSVPSSSCSTSCEYMQTVPSPYLSSADRSTSAFFVQITGAPMSSGNNSSHAQGMRGLHIYMIGVGVQQPFILAFTGLLIRFQIRYTRENAQSQMLLPMRLVYVLYAVLTLISIRIIFRLIEYSSGTDTGIPTHEAYPFVLESLPM